MKGRLGPGQLALRLVILLGPLVALISTGFVGAWPPAWLILVVAVLSSAFAVAPDGLFGTVTFVVVMAWWGLSLRDGLHPQAIIAAVALVGAHVAGVVASYAPPSAPVDRATTWLWTRRGALVASSAPVVWLLARLVRDEPAPAGIWIAGLATALVVSLAASTAFAARVGER